MDEHTIKCDPETRRNKEKVNHIKPIVAPKGQLLGTPQRSCQFCYWEKFLWLGVPQQTARLQKSIFPQYAIEIKCLTLKDRTSYLIPDGWSRSPLSFPIFSLNCYSTSSKTSKQYKHTIFHGVRSILAYIINNVKEFDIFQWIQYSFKYTLLDRKRYFY